MYSEIQDRTIHLEDYLKKNFHYENSTLKAFPEDTVCEKCNGSMDLIKSPKQGFLLCSVAINIDIYMRKCISCETVISFQGTTLGIINFANKFLICAEIIKEYFDQYSSNGTPFTSFFNLKLQITEKGNFCQKNIFPFADAKKLRSYTGQLHVAFCKSIEIILYDKQKFRCCESPKVLQMDGVVLSIKTEKMPLLETPWLKADIVNRASEREARQLRKLTDEEFKIVTNIIKSKTCDSDQMDQLSKSWHIGIEVLLCCLKNNGSCMNLYEGTELFAKTLIKELAPASSIIPNSCVTIIQK